MSTKPGATTLPVGVDRAPLPDSSIVADRRRCGRRWIADVGVAAGRARAVDDLAARDQEIEHGILHSTQRISYLGI